MSHVRYVRRGVVGIRVAYSYSLYFSEQLSGIKYFHPTYGLKDMNFYSFNQFLEFLLLNNCNIIQNSAVDWST